MSELFEETEICGLRLRNRFVRSATWLGLADAEGAVTDEMIERLRQLASGEPGLIIAGHAFVSAEGRAGMRQLGIHRDELVPGLRNMVRAVHECGGVIVSQLAHAGILGNKPLSGLDAWALSKPDGYGHLALRVMTADEIAAVVEAFCKAAQRACAAGFDGVQIHAAHGYLLSQSLSAHFNLRTDEYGGTIDNRARMLLDILTGIRSRVGENYPILIKLNCEDFVDGGLELKDSLRVGELLEKNGINAVEVSGGTGESKQLIPSRMGIKTPEREAYFAEQAGAFKKRLNVPVILVGGIRSYEVAERILVQDKADYLALCRPLICEPDLIKRWAAGDRARAKCLSDNLCFKPARAGEGVYCVTQRRKNQLG
ncbi:MAG TPA: NADH:flavin oxidoreductase [Myxococcota bacterium]|nr:NADH:flavin oxidoreductase [Myxococcota bacterium]